MSAPAFMPFYVAEYLADTSHLTCEEHGAYLVLILYYWQHGELPTDDASLARIVHLTPKNFSKIRRRLAPLFSDGWKHRRIEAERAKALKLIEKRKASGRVGGLAKASKRLASAVGVPRFCYGDLESKEEVPSETLLERVETPVLPIDKKTYAFKSANIRLTKADFDRWRESFPHLSLRAELEALDSWAGEQGSKWFQAVAGALAKKERAAALAIEREEREATREVEPFQRYSL